MSGFNFTSIVNGNAGGAQGKEGTTIQTLAISLASGFVLFAVQSTIFLVIRIYPWAKRIYQPRSFLVPLKNRIRPPPNNPFKWIVSVLKIPTSVILEKDGMDAYFFLRYLAMCLKIFLPMALIILPILLPINRVSGRDTNDIAGRSNNVTGLDTLAWTNISPAHTQRYWAHLVLAIGVIVWVCLMFHHEMIHYIRKRQGYLSHPGHRLKASATTVLITDIPADLCTVEKLTETYDDFPQGLRRVWINRDFKPLVQMVERRNKLEKQLETAETNLLRSCVKQSRKQKALVEKDTDITSSANGANGYSVEPQSSLSSGERMLPEKDQELSATTKEMCRNDLQIDLATRAAWTKYVSPKKRSTIRIPNRQHPALCKIPLLGRFFAPKVDTIYFSRRELARLNVAIDKETENSESYPGVHSAFLQFNSQKGAQLACQSLSHPLSKQMRRRKIELAPGDINWPSLGLPWWQRYIRMLGFLALFIIAIFVFGIISVFTGILSKASTLGGSTSWLHWITTLPSWLVSFIQGTLPPVILIVLLSGPLPIILRLFTNDIRGATTGTDGERSLQLWYFIFLLFELFIVPTLSAGLTSVVRELLNNPASVSEILAQNLPTAANYYFSFLVVQAFSISAASILQTIRLLNYYVLGSTNTPDSVFQSLTFTNRTRIGSNIPWYTTYAVIGLVYSVIAPLMLVFMLITFSLFYFVIKNNILYVIRTGNVDGGGLWFPSAINQTFTGLYFMEICLIGLFVLVRDEQNNSTCAAQAAIMVVALLGTILWQAWMFFTLHPLYTYLPVTLESDAQRRGYEYELERLTAKRELADIQEETVDEKIEDRTGSVVNDFGTAGETLGRSDRPGSAVDSNTKADLTEAAQDSRFAADSGSVYARPRASTGLTAASNDSRATHIRAQQDRDGQSAKRILARLNRPVDEARLAELEHTLAGVQHSLGSRLAPARTDVEQRMMDDPISKIIMQHNDELEDLDADERDLLVSVAFTHPILRETAPSVWIPQDSLGVSDDEVKRTREQHPAVVIENRGAFFNEKLKVDVNRPPPDMSEFALIMGEL